MPDRRIQRLLRDTFGLSALRPGQRQVIERVLAGLPTLAVMPTGAGKSLCYQLPALLLPGRTIVVSPLIALMDDQRQRLHALGVPAAALHSGLNAEAEAAALAAVDDGSARIVFVTPERLADRGSLERLTRQPVPLLVVDEAHCISQWGHDFRPAFLEIGAARESLGRPTVLALTATATDAVAADIAGLLGIAEDGIVSTGSYRANLHYRVEPVSSDAQRVERLLEIVGETSGAGIVYCATVKAAEQVHAALLGAGIDAALYHGRLAAARRAEAQQRFMSGGCRVMVATNAFGLGIDKADLRFVLHHQMPSGLDAYYQESGRAGRDGEAALATLLYLRRDKAVQQFFLANRYPAAEQLAAIVRRLASPPPDGAPSWTAATLHDALQLPRPKLQVALNGLRHERIVAQRRDGSLVLRRSGLGDDAITALAATWVDKRAEDQALLERMVFYAQTGWCRWRVLLEHFGSRPAGFDRCGHCDNCLRLARHLAAAAAEDPAEAGGEPQQASSAARPAAPAFAVGDAVRVRRYGSGRVVGVDAESVDVEFPGGEVRCFMRDWVQPQRRRAPRS